MPPLPRVLAIDPGYERMGIALLEAKSGGNATLLFSDCLRSSKELSMSERLAKLGAEISALIQEWQPSAIGLERLFMTNNQKTATAVAEVRGMLLYLAGVHHIPAVEYTPQEIKVATTGYGKSDKAQVELMVKKLVCVDGKKRLDDEYDAIAVGITAIANGALRY